MTSVNPGPAQSQVTNLVLPVGTYQLIEELQLSLTPASVAANTSAEQSFGLNGVTQATAATNILAGDTILSVNPPSLTAGTGIVGYRVDGTTNDKFYIEFSNNTAGALTPAAGIWKVVVARRTPQQLLTPLTAIQVGN